MYLKMIGVAALLILSLAGVAATFNKAFGSGDTGTVSCPQEDSCSADYHDGGWYINGVRVTK